MSVHSLFRSEAATHGMRPALADDGGATSYRELDAQSNALAWALRERGVGRGAFVGLALTRSRELVAAMLAILKAGGAYVPLDPAYPAERLRFMVEDARIGLVLTGVDGLPVSPAGAATVRVEDLARAPARASAPEEDVHPESAAYVMYTSGTTGRPKGVVVPHRAVVQLVRGQTYARFGPDEVVLHLAPISFDASTFEVWGALLNGARLAIYGAGMPSPRELGAFVRRHRVTTLWLTAAHFHAVVDQDVHELTSVRQLLAGGDVLAVQRVARVLQELPHVRLINGYGPTETTTFACCHTIIDAQTPSIPIGGPLAHTVVRVLDELLRPVPDRERGELCIGGEGVAHGYLDRPALTAERFVPDPLGGPGARLYRTGDCGRRLPEGALQFAGRRDAQVKVRGYRIELGEVEVALASLPGVRAAVAAAWPDEFGAKRLAGYVIADGALDERALRRALAERLPTYMIPSTVLFLGSLPISPAGKVDRSALPRPSWAKVATDARPLPVS